MKKYIKYLLSFVAFSIAASCTETVSLNDSVDNRVNKVINEYIDDLASAEHGWIANIMTSQGVYRFWMEFTDDNKVTMYTDNTRYPQYKTVPKTSTYNIRSLLLPTLSFDTYNYIHIINDPSGSISGGDGIEGLKTDFEFEILKYENDVFTLKGRLSRVDASLTRATADEKASVQAGGMMDVLEKNTSYKKGQFCGVQVGNTRVGIMFLARNIYLTWLDEVGKASYLSVYTYTDVVDRTVYLDKPTSIGGITFKAFHWDSTTDLYTLETADGQSFPVTISDDEIVSLFDMLGVNKAFSKMKVTYDMFVKEGMSDEEIAEVAAKNAFFNHYKNTAKAIAAEQIFMDPTIKAALSHATVEFTQKDEKLNLVLTLFIEAVGHGQYLPAQYTFPLTLDKEKKMVKLGLSMQPADDGEWSLLVYQVFAQQLCDLFKGAQFKLVWSHELHGTDLLGEMQRVVSGSQKEATVIGALQ